MKSGFIFFIIITGFFLILGSCEQPPELSSTPTISFEDVEFKDAQGAADTLIISINFEDNEGDLGIERSDLDKEAPLIFPLDPQGNYISFSNPNNTTPFHACDWAIDPVINGVQIEDTIRVKVDSTFYNYRIDIFRKVNGQYNIYDPRRISALTSCDPKDRNFLRINTQPNDRPLQGTLRYKYTSQIFGTLLRPTDSLKLFITIKDRAGNISNTVESNDFTLEGIKTN